jgi:hypothetical protein
VFGVRVHDWRLTGWAGVQEQFAIVDAVFFAAVDGNGSATAWTEFETQVVTRGVEGCGVALTHLIPPDQCDPINVIRDQDFTGSVRYRSEIDGQK